MHAMPGHGEGMHALEHSVEHQGIDIPTTAPDESTIEMCASGPHPVV